jgi:hypothetical protein
LGKWLGHDIKCPDSNPITLEFLLTVHRETGMPMGDLLDGTIDWLEGNINENGSFRAPETLLDYPHAWWMAKDIDPTIPDSIIGNLKKLELLTPKLEKCARKWTTENLNIDKIAANKWLFMAYHAFDYYSNIEEEIKGAYTATVKNIVECAQVATPNQYHTLFHFIKSPEDKLAKKMPIGLIDRFLDYMEAGQREDGGWEDEHDLKYWQPYITIEIMCALRNFRRI